VSPPARVQTTDGSTPGGLAEGGVQGGVGGGSSRAEQVERLRLVAPSLKMAGSPSAPGVQGALRIPKEWLAKMQKGK